MFNKGSKGKSKLVKSLSKSNMFRWLKDRKKQSKSGSRNKKQDDDYGFRSNNGSDNSDYGFGDRFHGQFHPGFKDLKKLDDPAYHIYEEIQDLPSLQGSPSSNSSHIVPVQSSQSRVQQIHEEGPYMVVPIVVHNINEQPTERCSACGEAGACSRLCNCEKSRTLKEENYNAPWDSSDESVISRLPNDRTCSEFSNFQKFLVRNRQYETNDAYLSSDKSDSSHSSRSSYSSRSAQSSRSNSEMECNDTCCEYDMSTSGESDVSEVDAYKSYLQKVQQNHLLKYQVRNIIRTLSKGDNNISEESSTLASDRSDVDSSISGRSSVPNVADLFESEVFIEKSESDDSSGYYECSDDIPQTVPSESIENLKPKRSQTKHKSHRQKIKEKYRPVRSQSCGAIQEDTEMYLLPTTKRDPEYNSAKLPKKPLLPPKSTVIYQDPNRTKNGSNNRLLGDLIRMNYERQHMIRV